MDSQFLILAMFSARLAWLVLLRTACLLSLQLVLGSASSGPGDALCLKRRRPSWL